MNMRNRFLTSLVIPSLIIRAFDTGKAGWKLDKDGHIEMKDGNPVWIDANGGESTLSGDTITRLNGEAKQLRIRAETAEAKAKEFEGIDATAARKALDTIRNIDAKKLIDAGEVERVRNEIADQYKTQLSEKDKALNEANSTINTMRIDGIFSNSKFIQERVAMPQDFFQSTMRSHFKIGTDGKTIEAYDKSGNRIMSKARIGDYATPDEALEIIVDSHPQKDLILKANNHSGSGNNGNGGMRPGSRTIRRADFDKLSPAEQRDTALSKEITIID